MQFIIAHHLQEIKYKVTIFLKIMLTTVKFAPKTIQFVVGFVLQFK